ncbi:hypothetical protein IFM89_010770 [Coptis chinensis]|uniref:DUF4283 domain-containing protein n=1 Tax=Coptis chinensis TaxID=261450 RepID=A0A835IJI4_9MAGN|nr:hypothetical protein IFM89_010770 [Coptis chinensis]
MANLSVNNQNFPPLHSETRETNNNNSEERALGSEQPRPTPWSTLFQAAKTPTLSNTLQKVDVQIIDGITQIPLDLVMKGITEWYDYVVGFFLEKRLPFLTVRDHLRKRWKLKGSFEMVADEEVFYFKFSNSEDRKRVLETGTFYISGRCFVISKWSQDIERRRNSVQLIPIWVNLHNVPKELWTEDGLSYLASRLGIPDSMDDATAHRKRLKFARVSVKVESTAELPTFFDIEMGKDDIRRISVEYGWIPKMCGNCKSFGHFTATCTRKTSNTEDRGTREKEVVVDNTPSQPESSCLRTVDGEVVIGGTPTESTECLIPGSCDEGGNTEVAQEQGDDQSTGELKYEVEMDMVNQGVIEIGMANKELE